MIPLLQRQIFRETTYLFFLVVGALLMLIIINRAIQMRDLFLGLDLEILDFLMLFSYMVPLFLILVIPIACMLSVFLTFLRMNTDKELTALNVSGISIYQMLPAPLLFSILCTLLTLWISFSWIAWGMDQFKITLLDIAKTKARISIRPGVFNKTFPGFVLFARQVDPLSGELHQILLEDRSQEDRHLVILATKGSIETNAIKGELIFNLIQGKIYTMSLDRTSFLSFDQYLVKIPLTTLLTNLKFNELRPKEMSWQQLIEEYKLPITAQYQNKISVELHKRWAYPIACVALTIFALPLATMFKGMHRQVGLILALLMFFIYYGLMSFGFSTGEAGTIPPSIGLWIPNTLFFFLGLYGIYLTAHEKTTNIVYLFQNMWKKVKGLA